MARIHVNESFSLRYKEIRKHFRNNTVFWGHQTVSCVINEQLILALTIMRNDKHNGLMPLTATLIVLLQPVYPSCTFIALYSEEKCTCCGLYYLDDYLYFIQENTF